MSRFSRAIGIGTLLLVLGAWYSTALLAGVPPVITIAYETDPVVLGKTPVTKCTVTVSGGVGTPTGTVTWSGGGGTFSSNTCVLSGGACFVTYTAGAADCPSVSLTATYSGDGSYDPGATSASLTVLRATATTIDFKDSLGNAGVLLVNEGGVITVTVRDTAGVGTPVPPGGTLTLTRSGLDGDAIVVLTQPLAPKTFDSSEARYTYTCTGLDLDGDVDTIKVEYTPTDGIHDGSSSALGQAIERRPTETTVDCTATPAGCDCTASTTEKGGLHGVPTSTIGKLLDVAVDPPAVLVNFYSGGPNPFSKASNSPLVAVSVKYEPTDRIHMASYASQNVTRDNPDWFKSPGPCGDMDVQAILYGFNAAVFAAEIAKLALDLAELIIDATPDPVVVVTTVPTSDLGALGIGIAKLALDAFIVAAEADLDLDDLPGLVEAIMLMSDFDPDMDDDGLGDREEIDIAGGHYSYMGRFLGNLPLGCACPHPTDPDSDDDGLNDGDELMVYFTDPCNPDTDGDGVTDGVEVATWASPDNRDHADPLLKDTDGDGISDFWEVPLGCLGFPDPRDGFVNSFDSDGDGLPDGLDAYADLPNETACAFPGMLYIVKVPGSGNLKELLPDDLPSICDEDSDGDGISDGFEHMRRMDWLDWDGDDDGRCDGHEVLGLGPIPTDPFDDDTDDDGVLDSAELWGSNPTNPVMPDTDGDGLCDGGANTPSGTGTNLLCTCAVGSPGGIGDHPNPNGLGEDENGNGSWDAGETNPNMHDTDGDGVGDGVEKLGFSTSRQTMIPTTDLLGCPITVTYPACGCMNPLNPDTDGDGLSDGDEDLNHDGNFDFLRSYFDHGHHGPIPGPAIPYPTETNPCDPDTDDDGLTDYEERYQPNPPAFFPFNPTNPLDHDTDNDWILDGPEVAWVCTQLLFMNLDNDGDGLIDEDRFDLVDNDADGLVDEDDVDFYVRFVPVLDPTNRDSDSDGFIDGLDADPCNTQLIPIVVPVVKTPVDTDGDGFADDDEVAAGTHPLDPNSKPHAFVSDLDLDQVSDDRLWLSDVNGDGTADTVTIDIDSNVLIDIRVQILARDAQRGDFDADGQVDDCRYVVTYAFTNRRVIQPRITLTIFDYDCDFVIDRVEVTK